MAIMHKLKSLVIWLKWELSTLLRLQEQRLKLVSTLLTTEVMVADAPKDELQPRIDMGGMGGMGEWVEWAE